MEGEPNSKAIDQAQPVSAPISTDREAAYWNYLSEPISEVDQPKKKPGRRRAGLRKSLSMKVYDKLAVGDIESPLYGH